MAAAAPRASRRDPQAGVVKLTLLIVSTVLVTEGALMAPALPAIQAHFSAEETPLLVRLLFTITPLSIALSAPFVGILADRVGRKPLLIGSLVLVALAGVAGYFTSSLVEILVVRAVIGLGIGGVGVGATALIADYYRGEQRERLLGLQGAFQGFSGVLFVIVAGILVDVAWNVPFLLFLVVLLLVPVIWVRLWEPEAGHSVSDDVPHSLEGVRHAVGEIPWRALAPIYAIVFFMQIVFFLVIIQGPFYLTEVMGASGATIGIALAVFTLFSGFSALAYGRLRSRFGLVAITAIMFAFWGVGYAIVGFAAGLPAVLAGLAVAGIGLGLLLPNMNNWVTVLTVESNRGRALGVLTGLFFLGQFVSPFITVPLGLSIGLAATFVATGALLLVLTVAFATLGRRWSPGVRPQRPVVADPAEEVAGAE